MIEVATTGIPRFPPSRYQERREGLETVLDTGLEAFASLVTSDLVSHIPWAIIGKPKQRFSGML